MKTKFTNGKILLFVACLYAFTLALFYEAKAASNTAWKGTVSGVWENPDNWSNGVPEKNTDVLIPERSDVSQKYPLISTAVSCKDLVIASGAFLGMNEGAILSVNGDWIHSGTFDCGKETVIFCGTTEIHGNFLSLHNVEISGTCIAPSGMLKVLGNWTNNGKFVHNNGTVKFAGEGLVGGDKETQFHHVIINGKLFAGTSLIRVSGNWDNSGEFNSGKSTVMFNGKETQSVNGSTSFYNMQIAGTVKGIILEANQHVNHDLTIDCGVGNINLQNFNIRNLNTYPKAQNAVALPGFQTRSDVVCNEELK